MSRYIVTMLVRNDDWPETKERLAERIADKIERSDGMMPEALTVEKIRVRTVAEAIFHEAGLEEDVPR